MKEEEKKNGSQQQIDVAVAKAIAEEKERDAAAAKAAADMRDAVSIAVRELEAAMMLAMAGRVADFCL